MQDSEPLRVGRTDRWRLAQRLFAEARRTDDPNPPKDADPPEAVPKEEIARRQKYSTPAQALTRGGRVEEALWIVDFMEQGEVDITSQEHKGIDERVAIDPDGRVWLISPLVE
jgi:hypothetical protein